MSLECNDEVLACTHLNLLLLSNLPLNDAMACDSTAPHKLQNIRRKQAAQRKRIRQKKDETAARQSARTAEEQVQHELFGEAADAGQLGARSLEFQSLC